MTSEEFERLLELPGGLARRRGGVRSMEGLYLRDRRGILSPEEQAEVDSLQFHLEGYKTTTSPIGRSASLRKVYEILQNGHFAKRDYFHLPSLANFWKNYESLAENYHSLTNESIFWFYAIAILVLFKDTKSRDIYLPSYSVIIIEGIIQCLLLEPKSSSRNDSEEPMVTPFRPINSHSNNFGRKRKFSSNQLASVEITLVETERSGFGSKRKLKGTDLRSERPDLETHTQLAVCIKCDENNAIFSIWSAFAELLQVDIESQRYSSDDLSLLSTFIINRYLNFLISIDVINGSQECDSSSQLQEILNFLRTSGVLQRASATVIRLIKQLRGRDPDYRESFNLWNILGILESACFQNISNQKFLTDITGNRELVTSLITILGELGTQIISIMPVHQKHDGLDTKNDSPQYRRCQEWEVLGDLHSLFLPSNFTTITSIFISFMEVNACKVIPQNIFEYHSSPQQITYSSSRKSSTNIVMIGIQDLWISCLKLAINLSHKNLSSHAGFLEIEYFEPILSIVDTFFNLRENFLTGTAEKFIFDGLLYLLTLLLNLVEAIPNHVQNEALQKLSNIVLKLDNKQTPLESTQTHENFLRYLLAIINRLSSSLLSDLEQTDQLLSRKLCKKHLIAIGGDDLHKNRVESRKQSLITEVNDTKKLPVDDIILCAHVILIFRTVLGQIPNDGSKDSLRHGIQSLLPRSSWWLPKRILMAYLALQDEIDTIRVTNVQPVINAIRYFDNNSDNLCDEPPIPIQLPE